MFVTLILPRRSSTATVVANACPDALRWDDCGAPHHPAGTKLDIGPTAGRPVC
jgi:hypothetical protein